MLLDMQIYMPSQDPLAPQDIAFTPRKIKKWIKDTPLTDLDAASQQLHELIAKSNRLTFPTKQRLVCVDLLQPLAKNLLDHLRKFLACQTFPLSPKAKEIYQLQQELNAEFSIAYKIIVLDAVQGDVSLDNRKILHCVSKAILYLQQQYLSCILIYQQVPANLWHDICQLYRVAEHYEIHKLAVKDEVLDKKTTIEDIFKHLCALTLISFNKLRQGEAEKVSRFLEQNQDLIDLTNNAESIAGDYIYIANLATGKSPNYYIPREMPISSENRFIGYASLVNKLAESTKKFTQSYSYYLQSSDELDPELAGRLIAMIGSPSKRSIKRIKSKETVRAIIGLSRVVQAINPIVEQSDEVTSENSFAVNSLSLLPIEESITKNSPTLLSTSPTETLSDVWNPFAVQKTAAQNDVDKKINSDQHPAQKVMSLDNWHVEDYSAGGFCLHYDAPGICTTRVGEVIAIRDQKKNRQPAHWTIGVIRWMQGLPNQGHKVGVELFGAECSCITASNKENSHQEYPGLLLKRAYQEKKSYSLILPANKQFDAREIILKGANSQRTVMLGRTLEKTSSFIHVEIVKIFRNDT